MLKFLIRAGLIRVVGRRAVPALMLIDVAMLANRARRIPVVDRNLRRGAAAVADQVASRLERWPAPSREPEPPRDASADPRSGNRANGRDTQRPGSET
jgi:hypothetical protein